MTYEEWKKELSDKCDEAAKKTTEASDFLSNLEDFSGQIDEQEAMDFVEEQFKKITKASE